MMVGRVRCVRACVVGRKGGKSRFKILVPSEATIFGETPSIRALHSTSYLSAELYRKHSIRDLCKSSPNKAFIQTIALKPRNDARQLRYVRLLQRIRPYSRYLYTDTDLPLSSPLAIYLHLGRGLRKAYELRLTGYSQHGAGRCAYHG